MSDQLLEPFFKAEYDLACAFADGNGANFEALALQLDSLRYRSPLFRCPRLFGFSVRSLSLRRHSRSIKFKVAWGYGAEDFRLGERRRVVLDDVVGLLDDGTYLWSELVIESGLLRELRLLGIFVELGQHLREPPRSLSCYQIVGFKYIGKQRQTLYAPDQLLDRRVLSNLFERSGNPDVKLTQLQSWILSLDSVTKNVPDRQLALRLRRARPASQQEIEAFEEGNQVDLPNELKELWSLSNGCAFFRQTVRGTYDSSVVRDDKRQMVLFADSEDFENYHVTIRNREPDLPLSNRNYVVSLEDWGTLETLNEWKSLGQCMLDLSEGRYT